MPVGDCTLEVIALAGHTPGSIALLYDDSASEGGHPHLFTGDSLFPGGVGNTFGDPPRSRQLLDEVSTKIFDRLPTTRGSTPATATTRRSAPSGHTSGSGASEAGERRVDVPSGGASRSAGHRQPDPACAHEWSTGKPSPAPAGAAKVRDVRAGHVARRQSPAPLDGTERRAGRGKSTLARPGPNATRNPAASTSTRYGPGRPGADDSARPVLIGATGRAGLLSSGTSPGAARSCCPADRQRERAGRFEARHDAGGRFVELYLEGEDLEDRFAARERDEPWLEAVHELVAQAPDDHLSSYAERLATLSQARPHAVRLTRPGPATSKARTRRWWQPSADRWVAFRPCWVGGGDG